LIRTSIKDGMKFQQVAMQRQLAMIESKVITLDGDCRTNFGRVVFFWLFSRTSIHSAPGDMCNNPAYNLLRFAVPRLGQVFAEQGARKLCCQKRVDCSRGRRYLQIHHRSG